MCVIAYQVILIMELALNSVLSVLMPVNNVQLQPQLVLFVI